MNEYHSLWVAVSATWQDIVFAMGISMVSGAVSHIQRFHRQKPRLFSVHEFCADTLSAGVLGFVIIMVNSHLAITGALQTSPYAVGALIPICGWGAPKLLEKLNQKVINSVRLDLGDNE